MRHVSRTPTGKERCGSHTLYFERVRDGVATGDVLVVALADLDGLLRACFDAANHVVQRVDEDARLRHECASARKYGVDLHGRRRPLGKDGDEGLRSDRRLDVVLGERRTPSPATAARTPRSNVLTMSRGRIGTTRVLPFTTKGHSCEPSFSMAIVGCWIRSSGLQTSVRGDPPWACCVHAAKSTPICRAMNR